MSYLKKEQLIIRKDDQYSLFHAKNFLFPFYFSTEQITITTDQIDDFMPVTDCSSMDVQIMEVDSDSHN